MKKYSCYVDESGKETKGQPFIVAVVACTEEREEMAKLVRLGKRKNTLAEII